MKETTAKFQRPGQKARFIYRAINFRGYLAQVVTEGVGKPIDHKVHWGGGDADVEEIYASYEDRYFPFFDGQRLSKDGFAEKIKHILDVEKKNDIRNFIGTIYEPYLIKWEGNEGDIIITDNNAERQAEQDRANTEHDARILSGDTPIHFYQGIFGWRIRERLPKELWTRIKHLGHYYEGNESDQEFADDQGWFNATRAEIRGWVYDPKAVEVLTEAGCKVQCQDIIVTNAAELSNAVSKIKAELDMFRKKQAQLRQDYRQRISVIKDVCNELADEKDCSIAEDLPEIHLPGHSGADIYGGGRWFHINGSDLYYVINNGADGDDWSRNNYHTGGAGAICYVGKGKAELLKKLQDWIESLGQDANYIKD
jgi:hypothetical protein